CTDGSFRFCRWRTHTEALSEDSGPEALSTQGQYFALHVFYEILKHIAGELSANCCRTITMTRYSKSPFRYECPRGTGVWDGSLGHSARPAATGRRWVVPLLPRSYQQRIGRRLVMRPTTP